MRTSLILLLVIFFSVNAFSQFTPVIIDEYTIPAEKEGQQNVVITMPYSKYEVSSIEGDTAGLRTAGDIFIDVVCTDYPSYASLELLNRNRLKVFFRLFHYVDITHIRKVNCIRQLNGAEKEKAQTMFHGMVITYRPGQTLETMKQDLGKLEEMLKPKEIPATGVEPVSVRPEKELPYSDSIKEETVMTGKTKPDTAYLYVQEYDYARKGERKIPDGMWYKFAKKVDSVVYTSKEAFQKHIIDKDLYKHLKMDPQILVYVDYYAIPTERYDSVTAIKEKVYAPGSDFIPQYNTEDSTVFKIFERNQWKHMAIVGDVTGSMYPYTGQLLLWLKLHSLDSFTKDFVFFNDGDNQPDNKKLIGKTGGIYFQRCDSFELVKELVKNTMLRGGGGDCPENNIEALLLSEKEFPNDDFQVLIADNWASVKDKELVKQLKKPVRIVLCGVQNFNVNVDYLNLARQTGGSVHLMEEDLLNLASLHEGEMIKIGRSVFKITNGMFVDISGQPGLQVL